MPVNVCASAWLRSAKVLLQPDLNHNPVPAGAEVVSQQVRKLLHPAHEVRFGVHHEEVLQGILEGLAPL
jgi:hypothetical protein